MASNTQNRLWHCRMQDFRVASCILRGARSAGQAPRIGLTTTGLPWSARSAAAAGGPLAGKSFRRHLARRSRATSVTPCISCAGIVDRNVERFCSMTLHSCNALSWAIRANHSSVTQIDSIHVTFICNLTYLRESGPICAKKAQTYRKRGFLAT